MRLPVWGDRISPIARHPALCILFVLFFPLLIEYVYSDFVRESELNSRVAWFLIVLAIAYALKNKPLTNVMLGVFLFSGIMDNLYAVTFSGVFTTASFEALAMTDTREALEFVPVYAAFDNLSLSAIYFVGSVYLMSLFQIAGETNRKGKFIIILGAILLMIAIYRIGFLNRYFDTVPGFLGTLPSYFKGTQTVSEEIRQRKALVNDSKITVTAEQPSLPQTYLVIIGESLTRKHMGIYGYTRNTTPELASLGENLFVFYDVVSGHAQTQPSLRKALTQSGEEGTPDPHEALSILDMANKAGFKTWWISNQQPLRATISAIASMADKTQFISNDFHGVQVRRFDGFLLPYVKEALQDPAEKKVIFVHLMGSHLQYENRYPESFAHFSDNKVNGYTRDLSPGMINIINAYDNSVLYTDHVTHEMIELLDEESKGTDKLGAALMFSDHGEEVFETRDFMGHGPDGVSSPMLEIPLLIWTSDAYRKQRPEKIAGMEMNLHSRYLLDDVFNTAVDMMGLRSDALNPQRSLVSERYQSRPRIIYGQDYDR